MKYPLYYLDAADCVTTPEEWCEATGWPEDEWMQLQVPEATEILEEYGLRHNYAAVLADRAYREGYLDACDEMERRCPT